MYVCCLCKIIFCIVCLVSWKRKCVLEHTSFSSLLTNVYQREIIFTLLAHKRHAYLRATCKYQNKLMRMNQNIESYCVSLLKYINKRYKRKNTS